MRFDFLLKKRASCLSFNWGLVSLAKLGVIEVSYASSHGTMPPSSGVGFGFVAIGLAKLGKNCFAKVSRFAPPGQANKSLNRNWQAAFNCSCLGLCSWF